MSILLETLSDEELARMTQTGDRAAFETLCDRYLPRVYGRLCALLPPEAVEDVTQEVFLAALRGIARYRGEALFHTWLSALIRHKVADYYRSQNRHPPTAPLDSVTEQQTASDAWEELSLVQVALSRLPVHYQEVLLMRFAEGLPFEQIARLLNLTLEATRSRYRRAVMAIAQEMETHRHTASKGSRSGS
jgi:RNA polymerase sigma-70 factor (ECF subfamily)